MTRRLSGLVVACLTVLSLLPGCSTSGSEPTVDLAKLAYNEKVPPVPPIDQNLAKQGQAIYATNCSACHGADLTGTSNWKIPDEEGNYPPPPLDSSGHAWHHPSTLLKEIIGDGSTAVGSAMVGFGDRLSESEIESVVEYLKTTWGPEEREFQWLVTWQESQRDG